MLDDICRTEIRELHEFFQDWFLGRLPAGDESFQRFARAMDPAFTMITPAGALVDLADLTARLRQAHGSRADSGFTIRVRPVSVLKLDDGLALAVYEEWQSGPEGESAWTSSALLRRDKTAPGGIRWLHVHETYLPGMERV